MAWHNTKPGKSRWMAEIVAKVGIVLIVASLVAVARLQECTRMDGLRYNKWFWGASVLVAEKWRKWKRRRIK